MNGVEFSFNWFYADDRDIAHCSERTPSAPCGGNRSCAADERERGRRWRGFVPFAGHARAIDPPSAHDLNWNNRPAASVGAADSNFSYGSVHRVDLLAPPSRRKKHSSRRSRVR